MRRLTSFFLSILLLTSLSVNAFAQSSATEFIRQKSDEIIRIINTSKNKAERVNRLKSSVGQAISFEQLSKATLGKHWDGLSAKQRKDFVEALQALIETNYSSRLGDQTIEPGSYSVEFTDEKSRRGRTTVSSTITVKKKQHYVDVRLTQDDNGSWQIYDIVTDDISLQESYAESFDEIIKKHGFDELLRRIRANTLAK